VKTLANQTSRATGEIGAQIAEVQTVTREAVAAIDSIARTIAEIDQGAAGIAAAVEQQNAATAEIARNVGQAATGTREVTASIGRVNAQALRTGASVTQVTATADLLIARATGLAGDVGDFLSGVDRAGDRRRHPRKAIELTAEIEQEGARRTARTVDLSLGGARLDRDIGAAPGATVAVALEGLPPLDATVVGTVEGQSRVRFSDAANDQPALAARLAREG
jgi:methyl-accepting chemotaxis protein